ncbi:hypothetical protein BLX41_07140 [Pseudomonas protegens]|uniref:hypothetical protein n=1 Tax=Pseudomonas protegens TaxID=380021 RepID=UPI000F4CB2D2|nr:hypothetical protein [Pseudomonas protegens]ROL80503.1 hypothetical protein BLX41_07140 [Pseudomonas protegens]
MSYGATPSLTFSPTPKIIVIFLMVLVIVAPRLILAGGLPTTDEGFYAYYAQIMNASLMQGSGLPDTGPLMLYPLLVNWVFASGTNPMVALRLIDLVVAGAAGYALFRVIEIESRSRLGAAFISALFLFTMNETLFIQYGFKNSIHAAYLPLFAALWLGLNAPTMTTAHRWSSIGALLSTAVLLRETFMPLAALGAIAVLISRGLRPFSQLIAGASCAGALITGAILAARGGLSAALEGYRDAGLVYASVAEQRAEFFFNSGAQALRESIISVGIAGVGVGVTLARSISKKRITSWLKLVFWLSAALLPLLEPATKIGFPYHFGVCLVGLAGLTALGWRNLSEGRPDFQKHLITGALGVALLVLIIPRLASFSIAWPQTREVLAAFKSGEWPEKLSEKTNYLLAAQVIRQAAPAEATVAVSGFMFSLYPLTGHLPPAPELSNLSATLIKLQLSSTRLREILLRCPPDVLMTTSRSDWPGGPELLAAVRDTGIYEEIAKIPASGDRAYGNFGGIVFRTTKKFPCESLAEEID